MKEIELAWLAGIMEGEGTFSIYHQRKSSNGAKNGLLRGTVSLTNTDPFLINKAVEIFKNMGVSIHINSYDNKKGSTKTVYDVATSKFSNVKKICESLLPYLVGEKKAKATMLLTFVSQRLDKGHGPYDDDDWNHFKKFRSPETTCETLNRDEDIVQQ